MKKRTFAALLLAACTTTALAGQPQDLPATNVSKAVLATAVVRDYLREGEYTPAQPRGGDLGNPFSRTVPRTDLAEDDLQPAHPLPVE